MPELCCDRKPQNISLVEYKAPMVSTNIKAGLKIPANPKLIQIGFHFGFQGSILRKVHLHPFLYLHCLYLFVFCKLVYKYLLGNSNICMFCFPNRGPRWTTLCLFINYPKIPNISPGTYIFQRPFFEGLIFGGAYLRREICVSKSIGLSCSGFLRYDFGGLIHGRAYFRNFNGMRTYARE